MRDLLTEPCTRAEAHFSLFQSFFGWHFLGLLSQREPFTQPPSLAVSNTDLMGREGGKGSAIRQMVGQTQPSKEQQSERETDWEGVVLGAEFLFCSKQAFSFKHQQRISSADVK